MSKIGILLTNTGTPDAPTQSAVRRYLKEFLSDRRVIKLPKAIWLPILYGYVLPLRPVRSAKLYQKIWTVEGSPMRLIMDKVATALEQQLQANGFHYRVCVGMNYGTPSIPTALKTLSRHQVEEVIVLPLFPQYSNTTTAASLDKITAVSQHDTSLPVRFIKHYAKNRDYIHALADSIRNHWAAQGLAQHLLISFHGIPERYIQEGDPYQQQCENTAQLLAQVLQLTSDQWTLCYQSRFGYNKWLKPSTQKLLTDFPKKGIKEVDVVCPGFSVDCLETLEEVAIRGREMFLAAGGKTLRYIPALNDSATHIDVLFKMISSLSS